MFPVRKLTHKAIHGSLELFTSFLYLISFTLLPVTKIVVHYIFKQSDIQINGKRKWDPKVTDNRFYCLLAKYSYVGLVIGYANGYYECNDINEFMVKVYSSKYYKIFCYHPSLYVRSMCERHFFKQSESVVTDEDTKLMDDAYEAWNFEDDETFTFSSGYWKEATSLQKAVEAKFDLIAKKLKLKPGMRVLDVGCGDGTFCKFLAEKYDVKVTGINVCKKAVERARKSCKGLKASFEVKDAKAISGTFDRITCIGMIEHLGILDWKVLFEAVRRCLVDDGIFILETYTINHTFVPTNDGTMAEFNCSWCYYMDVMKSIEGLFIIEDLQNLRYHLTRTMKCWSERLDDNWDQFVKKSGVQTARMLRVHNANMYAMCYSGYFQIHQMVLSKNGLLNGYNTLV